MSILDTIKNQFSKNISDVKEHSKRRIYITIEPRDIIKVADFVFKNLGCRFATASGIDTPNGIEILYHFSL
ncbi:MAG: NADH-quinone oxidoreductase subunit C, partial [Candidatus Omnitrophica bacterium]|nr:NADH-quinone oxidoreductase subunit C [Candidatus Omnitrophota bacterium]